MICHLHNKWDSVSGSGSLCQQIDKLVDGHSILIQFQSPKSAELLILCL